MISQVLFPRAAEEKQNGFPFQIKLILDKQVKLLFGPVIQLVWYIRVVYTETIIYLSVGESDGYLPPFRLIIQLMVDMEGWKLLIVNPSATVNC